MKILTKDEIFLDIVLRNQFSKYYQDIRGTPILLKSSSVVYPVGDSLAFGYISFADLPVGDHLLKDVPYITTLSGDKKFNTGSNFFLVS